MGDAPQGLMTTLQDRGHGMALYGVLENGRRARGDRTRSRVALRAAELATVSGLESVTIGRLAAETGLTKSGILTVFPNRVAIQLAAVTTARTVFADHVLVPAWHVGLGQSG